MLQFLIYYKLQREFQTQVYLDVVALMSSEKVPSLSGKKMLSGKMLFHVEVCDILTTLLQLIKHLRVLTLQKAPMDNKIFILFLPGFSTGESQQKI